MSKQANRLAQESRARVRVCVNGLVVMVNIMVLNDVMNSRLGLRGSQQGNGL